ncbi:MAG: hypothetical protein ACI3X6_00330 [Alloprevotella sp.]
MVTSGAKEKSFNELFLTIYISQNPNNAKRESKPPAAILSPALSININMRDFPALREALSGRILSRRFSFALQN